MENLSLVPTAEAPAPSTQTRPQKSKSNQGRDKTRQEAFRQKKGSVAQTDFKSKIMSKYQLDDPLVAAVQSPTNGTVPIPITTRGIGFALVDHYAYLRNNSIQIPPTILSAYRVSLAQLHLKLAKIIPGLTCPPHVPEPPRTFIDADFGFNFTSDRNFSLIAQLVNSCGNVERHQNTYLPYVCEPPICRLPGPGVEPQFYRFPDPFHVTWTNLREIVEALENPRVPFDQRHFFRSHNPIPGAEWDANSLLVNAEDIMPTHMTFGMIVNEAKLLSFAFNKVGKKAERTLGRIEYSGKGSDSILASLTLHDGRSWRIDTPYGEPAYICNGIATTTSSEWLEGMDMLMANLTMLGEVPPAEIRELYPHAFVARDFHAHSHYVEYGREGLVIRLF